MFKLMARAMNTASLYPKNNARLSRKSSVYLDNTATSWPKPPGVAKAVAAFFEYPGANPGRSGHRLSNEAARVVYETREALAALFNLDDPLRVVFGQNITEAINLALQGLLRPGDHVVTTGMEHNAVMRPLRMLESRGVRVTAVPCSRTGLVDPEGIEAAIRPQTVMVVVNRASNVSGTIQPISRIGEITRRRGLLLLTDEAQSAGVIPVDMQADRIDLLAFTGHKSLYGPTGTGGLLIGERVDLERFQPLCFGGTGSRSEFEFQPEFLPDRFESGTMNTAGLAGLNAALGWLSTTNIETIREHETSLCSRLIDGLLDIPGTTVYGPLDASLQTAAVSFTMEGYSPSEIGQILDEQFNIYCRVGLHCAPAAHRTLGTFPSGTVRLGPGFFNTQEDVECTLEALAGLAKDRSQS